MIDSFADIRILRYKIDGFDALPLKKKLLLFYLSEAALWGRDIFWHQNGALGLTLRSILEAIYVHQKSKGALNQALAEYTKRVWFANGLHHHYSNDKFRPAFSKEELANWALAAGVQDKLSPEIENLIFNPTYKAKKVSLDTTGDVVTQSAVNFYQNVTQKEVETFYANGANHPLNSQLVKGPDGEIKENVWTENGMYGPTIAKIIFFLRKAASVATNDLQAQTINLLIKYYQSGNPQDFDEFNKVWVSDKQTDVDFINGFIEVYDDPMGLKGTWESIVELTNPDATRQTRIIAANAQWFEDNSPIAPEYRKKEVTGVSMNVIDAVMLAGDCYPSTPIGVNLPNADWIREQYGSKSISLANITRAYHEESLQKSYDANGQELRSALTEFALTEEERTRSRKYGRKSDELHTQLHECLGHGSGQMREGISLENLKAYGSTIEEARADLFALYFMADPKMLELGIISCLDEAWAHYDSYIRGGILTQLARIEEGCNIEEAHMRNRALIARWTVQRATLEAENGVPACQIIEVDGKHFTKINDYQKVRTLFGELLHEVQRIKSEGDYSAARSLIETYGVQIDPALHHEIKERYATLKIKPFSGFVNPLLTPVTENGKIIDVKISYDEQYDEQMLRYSRDYSVNI